MKYYLAIDLGASSGRHIIGYKKDDKIILEEIYRFTNSVINSNDGLVWDVVSLYKHVLNGIKIALKKYKNIESLAIDSWGVDYALMEDNKTILPYYAYRNSRVDDVIDEVHKIIPFEELYKRTGIQFAKFNSIYQLFCDKKQKRIGNCSEYLMIPEFLTYSLTGKKVHEYTNATTMGLVNLKTKEIDLDIVKKLGLPTSMFTPLVKPGFLVGSLRKEVQSMVGGNINVVMCASHDTASAFEAIDTDEDSIILSSGTWSLIGVKIKYGNNSLDSFKSNFTNEGGVGYIRYLKNIMGMWICNSFLKDAHLDRETAMNLLKKSTFDRTFDANSPTLLAPTNMKNEIINLLGNNKNLTDGDIYRSIFCSLALSYKKAIEEIEHNLNRTFSKIYIIGGGANNTFLNEQTEHYTNKKVIAMPVEATALGNIKVQMKEGK